MACMGHYDCCLGEDLGMSSRWCEHNVGWNAKAIRAKRWTQCHQDSYRQTRSRVYDALQQCFLILKGGTKTDKQEWIRMIGRPGGRPGLGPGRISELRADVADIGWARGGGPIECLAGQDQHAVSTVKLLPGMLESVKPKLGACGIERRQPASVLTCDQAGQQAITQPSHPVLIGKECEAERGRPWAGNLVETGDEEGMWHPRFFRRCHGSIERKVDHDGIGRLPLQFSQGVCRIGQGRPVHQPISQAGERLQGRTSFPIAQKVVLRRFRAAVGSMRVGEEGAACGLDLVLVTRFTEHADSMSSCHQLARQGEGGRKVATPFPLDKKKASGSCGWGHRRVPPGCDTGASSA